MSIAQSLLQEFEHEYASTRRVLERVPAGKLGWRPHPKSMTAGELAMHVAGAPGQVAEMALADEIPVPSRREEPPADVASVLEAADASAAAVRRILPRIDDGRMAAPFRIVRDGKTILEMPRAAFLRSILLNHLYHHRAQLGVYLRLLDVPVPSCYGPTADEAPDFLAEA